MLQRRPVWFCTISVGYIQENDSGYNNGTSRTASHGHLSLIEFESILTISAKICTARISLHPHLVWNLCELSYLGFWLAALYVNQALKPMSGQCAGVAEPWCHFYISIHNATLITCRQWPRWYHRRRESALQYEKGHWPIIWNETSIIMATVMQFLCFLYSGELLGWSHYLSPSKLNQTKWLFQNNWQIIALSSVSLIKYAAQWICPYV